MLARNEFVLRAQALAMAEACLSKQELSLFRSIEDLIGKFECWPFTYRWLFMKKHLLFVRL